MSSVYYLSYSDIPNKDGLVFPNELLKDTYSIGTWAVALKTFLELPNEFDFDAVDNGELVTLKLIRISRNVYYVDSFKYGLYFFRIIHINYRNNKYVGNSKLIDKENSLYQVISMNVLQLSNVCSEKGFYFVGAIDGNLEHRTE